MNNLSDRLQTIADKIRQGEIIADIGTDHGLLPAALYVRGVCPRVILSDISPASLDKSVKLVRKLVREHNLEESGLSLRVGNGLSVLSPGEADTVVIAGMGGLLIRDIMKSDPEVTRSVSRFILQPRSAAGPLRKWLLEAGFSILSEDIVREGDFLPEIISAAQKRDLTGGDPAGEAETVDSERGEAADLAAGFRRQLRDLGEEDIRFRVPPWMEKAFGPVEEFLDRKAGEQRRILAGLRRAANPDERAIGGTEENIEYLEDLKRSFILRKHSIGE